MEPTQPLFELNNVIVRDYSYEIATSVINEVLNTIHIHANK